MCVEERLDAYFNRSSDSQSTTKYLDAEIDKIAGLLQQCNPLAAKCPRTYIVLRTIGRLDCLEGLLREDFGDHWFPLAKASSLPSFLEQKVANDILDAQSIIETEVLKFSHGSHLTVNVAENRLFTLGPVIGSGKYGQVNIITSKVDFDKYALKRIRRKELFGNSRGLIKSFIAEKSRLQKLKHLHIVQYIGSYTDARHLGLVMAPVADCNLAEYMDIICSDAGPRDRATLQTFFGCLATALGYLHTQSIKHRDIKPANILVHRSHVLITDFGISHDSLDTTSGVTVHTPRYSAPEVTWGEKRNESADIWSLGCVFLEMAAALHGQTIESIRNYYSVHASQIESFHSNPKATETLIETWHQSWSPSRRPLLQSISDMLIQERRDRPSATRVLEILTTATKPDEVPSLFCGTCCFPDVVSDAETASLNGAEVESDLLNNTEQRTTSLNDDEVATPLLDKEDSESTPIKTIIRVRRSRRLIPMSRNSISSFAVLAFLVVGVAVYSVRSDAFIGTRRPQATQERFGPSTTAGLPKAQMRSTSSLNDASHPDAGLQLSSESIDDISMDPGPVVSGTVAKQHTDLSDGHNHITSSVDAASQVISESTINPEVPQYTTTPASYPHKEGQIETQQQLVINMGQHDSAHTKTKTFERMAKFFHWCTGM
ncbi:kinase-like domain-containing protein [Boeremia exigua]|uniref:kinase-like domain-containing protein n=1 Tax=Boeremia exigua TaxID=749465 RepID=UPI001E8D14F4|nr:kinase-like domain-containing protein [Boeremia exigua]KAH6629259.1 kinase-like domain-containing protein [Boeremia exigua]